MNRQWPNVDLYVNVISFWEIYTKITHFYYIVDNLVPRACPWVRGSMMSGNSTNKYHNSKHERKIDAKIPKPALKKLKQQKNIKCKNVPLPLINMKISKIT